MKKVLMYAMILSVVMVAASRADQNWFERAGSAITSGADEVGDTLEAGSKAAAEDAENAATAIQKSVHDATA